jgi:hypothetical protein
LELDTLSSSVLIKSPKEKSKGLFGRCDLNNMGEIIPIKSIDLFIKSIYLYTEIIFDPFKGFSPAL